MIKVVMDYSVVVCRTKKKLTIPLLTTGGYNLQIDQCLFGGSLVSKSSKLEAAVHQPFSFQFGSRVCANF